MPESISGGTGWSVDVRWGDDALSGLAGDWDGLYRRCSTATPFQARVWLVSWWKSYGSGRGRLCLVGVRHDGDLVAAAVMVRRRRGLLRVLEPVGIGQSDFCDVLVDDRGDGAPDPGVSAERLAAAIRGAVGFDAMDFPDVRPDSAIGRIHSAWPKAKAAVPGVVCLYYPVKPVEQFVRELPSSTRKGLRKKLRAIDRSGLEARRVPTAEAGQAVADLLALHREQWADRTVSPEHLLPRFQAFLAAVASHPEDESDGFEAAVFEYSRKNEQTREPEVVAFILLLANHGLVGGYLYGFRPELRDEVDIRAMFFRTNMAFTADRAVPELSMLRGAEPHKYRLHPVEARNTRLLLAGSPLGTCWLMAIRLRGRAVKVVKYLTWHRAAATVPPTTVAASSASSAGGDTLVTVTPAEDDAALERYAVSLARTRSCAPRPVAMMFAGRGGPPVVGRPIDPIRGEGREPFATSPGRGRLVRMDHVTTQNSAADRPSAIRLSVRRLPLIMMYHSVAEREHDPHGLAVSPVRFAEQMETLRRRGLRGVSMAELTAASAAGSARGLVGITFDDGYADIVDHALPVLRHLGFTATAFVLAGRIGGVNEWDEGTPWPLLDASGIRSWLDAGFEVGSHGTLHLHLAGADPKSLQSEVAASRDALAELTGQPIAGYAYAYGSMDEAARAAVAEAGYEYACAVGASRAVWGRFAWPRLYVGDRDSAARIVKMLTTYRLNSVLAGRNGL